MIHLPTQSQQPHSRWWSVFCISVVCGNKQILTFVKGMKMFLFEGLAAGSPRWESGVKMILCFTKVSFYQKITLPFPCRLKPNALKNIPASLSPCPSTGTGPGHRRPLLRPALATGPRILSSSQLLLFEYHSFKNWLILSVFCQKPSSAWMILFLPWPHTAWYLYVLHPGGAWCVGQGKLADDLIENSPSTIC